MSVRRRAPGRPLRAAPIERGGGRSNRGGAPAILAFAYACEPGKGSEPGAGWGLARGAARLAPTWVITRANNRPVIEAALPELPERDRLHFVYVDLPRRAMFWKRGTRGVRLYYLLWQLAALRCARRLQLEREFAFAWHLTLATAWLGSAAPMTGLPFVYGPVGGGVPTSWRLFPSLGVKGSLYEVGATIARSSFRSFNPLCRMAMRRAAVILVQNEETRRWVPASVRRRAVVSPNAIVDVRPATGVVPGDGPRTALFAGRLIPWKGVALAIRAIALTPGWRLLVCGSGWDERRLRRLARRLRVEDRVRFLGQRPQAEIHRLMARADVFLFPSLHDEGPAAVAEALAIGIPVICLDRGGPAGFGGTAVPVGSVGATVRRLSGAIRDARPQAPARRFFLESVVQEMSSILRGRGLLPEDAGPRVPSSVPDRALDREDTDHSGEGEPAASDG
ncbi:MAG TPA: glycosyltransferase [Actinomycetota bacterium]